MRENKSNKVTNLEILKKNKRNFIVPNFFFLSYRNWKKEKKNISNYIQLKMKAECSLVAVRSAFSEEDGKKSFAGAFSTLLNIDVKNNKSVNNAINDVFKSYLKHQNKINDEDGLIIQLMIKNTSMSGVVFTHELNTGAPYLVINYDDKSGETDTVTSGIGEYSNRTLYIYRNKKKSLQSKRFQNLVKAIINIEKIFKSEHLDIEFAMDYENNVYIFQTRSQTNIRKWSLSELNKFEKLINKAQSNYKKIQVKTKSKKIVLGQMPDWNPAEIIGNYPDRMSVSLYKYLITDSIWSVARKEMNYKFVNKRLMEIFCGRPFINTNLSFNSFIPNSLSGNISRKLVDFWLNKLSKNPHLHDKVEFDVATTFFDFNLYNKLNSDELSLLSNDEKISVYNSYKDHFLKLFSTEGKNLFELNIKKISKLNNLQSKKNFNKLSLFELLENCKIYGTFSFSIFARFGFISKILIDSLTKLKIFSKKQNLNFFLSVETCATQLVKDFNSLEQKRMNEKNFMQKYGFLRPGTYDITSTKYSEMKNFFNKNTSKKRNILDKKFKISQKQSKKIKKILENLSVEKMNTDNFIKDLKKFIFYREESKFIFSKSVSRSLDLLKEIFNKKLTTNEIKNLDINEVFKYLKNNKNINDLKKIIKKRLISNNLSKYVRLPQLITNEKSFHIIPFQVSKPNFIVKKKVTSDIVFLDKQNSQKNIDNKIVVIENADPGFDWIFTKDIVGLITKYGGANSHMAIRSAEFDIACAIGSGEQQFEKLKKFKNITIDGVSENIIVNY